MSLELRCPDHPLYTGATVPGSTVIFAGSQACAGCWEKFRQVQASAGNPAAR